MDRLDSMSILLAVVEAGSLSGAGRKLGASLPTVSRKLSELETHLNARLLVRSTRRLTLTDAGAAYAAACRRILEQVGEAERAASGEWSAPRGELIVSAPVAFGRLHVLPAVAAFLADFPEVSVRLGLSDRYAHLIGDHVDVAARIGALPDSQTVATRIGSVRRVVCASPDLLARHGAPEAPADLARWPCVTFEGLGSSDQWTFAGAGKAVPVRSRLSVGTAEAAVDAAAAGVGATRVLSYQAADAVRDGRLQIVLARFEPEPLPVSLVHAAQGALPLKARSFIDHMAPRLRAALSGAEAAMRGVTGTTPGPRPRPPGRRA